MSIRPWSSAGTSRIDAVPIPRNLSARSRVECRLAPATMRIGGAPLRPSRSTSHPTPARTWWRAAARQVKCAIWQPVTNPNEESSGRPRSSFSHVPATSSTTLAAGVGRARAAFWSQADVSQSAAIAAGVLPPMTKPKKRPLGMPIRPGSASRASRSTTSSASEGCSGSGPPRAARSSSTVASGRTGRSSSEST